MSVLSSNRVKYVLNCAAITDIEWCEKNPKECMKVNTEAVKDLENICFAVGKKLIQISSNYACFPTNVYGKSKRLMEESFNHKRSLIIRTSFYYEGYDLFKNLINYKKVDAFSNSYFNPISIYRLAEEINRHKDDVGLLDVFSSKKISKYDFALLFCKVFNLNSRLIKSTLFKNSKNKAKRPFNSFVPSDVNINLEEDMAYFKRCSDFSKDF